MSLGTQGDPFTVALHFSGGQNYEVVLRIGGFALEPLQTMQKEGLCRIETDSTSRMDVHVSPGLEAIFRERLPEAVREYQRVVKKNPGRYPGEALKFTKEGLKKLAGLLPAD